jgi:hypothetical protein
VGTRDGSIDLIWPDEERTFRLRLGELRELQEKCGNRGPMTIVNALTMGTWLVDDIVQPIRLGLIGAGMSQADAAKLVQTHLGDGRLKEGIFVAQAIVMRAITGPPDEKLDPPKGKGGKETDGGKTRETRTPSASVSSTDRGRPAASPRSKSTR